MRVVKDEVWSWIFRLLKIWIPRIIIFIGVHELIILSLISLGWFLSICNFSNLSGWHARPLSENHMAEVRRKWIFVVFFNFIWAIRWCILLYVALLMLNSLLYPPLLFIFSLKVSIDKESVLTYRRSSLMIVIVYRISCISFSFTFKVNLGDSARPSQDFIGCQKVGFLIPLSLKGWWRVAQLFWGLISSNHSKGSTKVRCCFS